MNTKGEVRKQYTQDKAKTSMGNNTKKVRIAENPLIERGAKEQHLQNR